MQKAAATSTATDTKKALRSHVIALLERVTHINSQFPTSAARPTPNNLGVGSWISLGVGSCRVLFGARAGGGLLGFLFAHGAHDVPHAVVPLVAGVLEDRVVRLRHLVFERPRHCPGVRILHLCL